MVAANVHSGSRYPKNADICSIGDVCKEELMAGKAAGYDPTEVGKGIADACLAHALALHVAMSGRHTISHDDLESITKHLRAMLVTHVSALDKP